MKRIILNETPTQKVIKNRDKLIDMMSKAGIKVKDSDDKNPLNEGELSIKPSQNTGKAFIDVPKDGYGDFISFLERKFAGRFEIGPSFNTLETPTKNFLSGGYKTLGIKDSDGQTYYAFIRLIGNNGVAIKPPAAEDFELGIAVAYNMKQGMSKEEAIKEADISNGGKEKLEDSPILLETGRVVAEKIKVGPSIKHFGSNGDKVVGEKYPKGTSPTAKTDLLGNKENHISVKKSGGSQLMSGSTATDGKGVLASALLYYDSYNDEKSSAIAKEFVDSLNESGNHNKINADLGIKGTSTLLINKFKEWRYKNIKSQHSKLKDTEINNHIATELVNFNITNSKPRNAKLSDNIPVLTKDDFNDWLKNGINANKSLSDKIMQDIESVYYSKISHKKLEKELKDNLETDPDLAKWAVYEAMTGLYKFNNTIDINTKNLNPASANTVLVFDDNTFIKYYKITPEIAAKVSGNIEYQINFKSSQGKSYTALRMLFGLTEMKINESIEKITNEYHNQLLQEGILDFTSKFAKSTKAVGKWFKDSAVAVGKAIADLFKKLYEWSSNGVLFLLEKLGIKISGEITNDPTIDYGKL